ncbi:5'-tyrosyl-DNA phosphodiesterase-like [Dioscorea cayenensis subsp. rotundata]|uniref:5'-tyrosyl-DNA phosphodiesterase-like n=1 Tax=Dioscorea cayennensis subsp. rotundata TaxID=55577 RepID=A0AB40ATA4_DIOCR|nr:5'-tyrosyl-DNA phosphodiesterase-like [Dioscorea cayenensis subsp. rotundata]
MFALALKFGAAVAGGALLALGALSLGSQSQELEPLVSTGERYESNSSPVTTRERNNICISPTKIKIKIMSYNVWSREDVEVEERIKALGRLVQEHSPDVIFFQEVTPRIYKLFLSSSWWHLYKHSSVSPEEAEKGKYFCMLLSKVRVKNFISIPFKNSSNEKGLLLAAIEIGLQKTLIVATSHLKSPNPPEMHSKKRVSQAKAALGYLQLFPNVVFGGDMNWDENIDGTFPLQGVWKDAWTELRGGEDGWTFDTKSNPMLQCSYPLQKRLDRFVCKLEDCSMKNVEMIGKKPIPGMFHHNKGKVLPVLPSDHYGLILTISVNV